VLKTLVQRQEIGLLFSNDGKPVEYRTIQHYYNLAFKRAGLPYTATHVLRHGWTREVYNQTPDLAVAKELLGDTSDEAAKVYAIRRAGALTRVSDLMWNEHEVGRKWSQIKE
jgi:site-specific recombinase XerC